MANMKRFKDDVIRINEISDIYKTLSEMIDILTATLSHKPHGKY